MFFSDASVRNSNFDAKSECFVSQKQLNNYQTALSLVGGLFLISAALLILFW